MKSYHDIPNDGGSGIAGQLDELAARMQARMARVRHVVAVVSGKGGVGKSTLAANVASALALEGYRVGIADGDINGPSIARITGVVDYEATPTDDGLLPAEGHAGVRIMSMGLFLPAESTPVVWDAPTQQRGFAWRGLREAGALRALLADTAWGTLDFLIVDLPPGPEKLGTLVDVLPGLSGAVAVTIPSAVSAAAVAKSIRMAQQVIDAPIVGLIENMSGSVCTECGHTETLFPEGATDALSAEMGVEVLARIPFDPLLAVASDEGICYVDDHAERPAARALRALARRLVASIASSAATPRIQTTNHSMP